MMVVVTIIGIMSALVGPSFRSNLKQGAGARQARGTAEMFHEARAEATATGRAMFLLIEGAPGSSAHRLIARPGPSSSCALPAGTPASFWSTDVYYRDSETRSDAPA